MIKNYLFLGLLFTCTSVFAQLQMPPSGGNQKSVVTQYMGAHAHVTITYNSPDVASPSGQSRKGQIWGQLVPYGLNNLNFGISTDENPSPWRAGANENTTIEFSHAVKIEGKSLVAGRYGLHLIPRENEPWTLILSNNSDAWGSYFYKEEDDALRVDVQPAEAEYQEYLNYSFENRREEGCTANLNWENLSIPFRIEVENPKEIYVNHLRASMQSTAGFNWPARNAAAQYCLQNDLNLEEALAWQKVTATNSFQGQENFQTLQTLAMLQMKLGKTGEFDAILAKAVEHPSTNVFQVHQLGRQLITMDKPELAMKMFKWNVERFGDVWPVNVGLARGYSAVGEYDKALEHAEIALERAPDKLNKDGLTNSIELLKQKQDIN